MKSLYHLRRYALVLLSLVATACQEDDEAPAQYPPAPLLARFAQAGTTVALGAAEISAYDATTRRLFTVSDDATTPRVAVFNMANPHNLVEIAPGIPRISGATSQTSVATYNGRVAVAYDFYTRNPSNTDQVLTTPNGVVRVYDAATLRQLASINVGPLPDMVTFTPDGRFILVANEGEPNVDYTSDPAGSITVIDANTYQVVTTLTFNSADVLGSTDNMFLTPGVAFANDIEPEFITVAADGQTAWVSLQENNAIARINLSGAVPSIAAILPLGFKNYGTAGNEIDVTDRDTSSSRGSIRQLLQPNVFGVYQPDGLAAYLAGGVPYVFSANEGDARDDGRFTVAIGQQGVRAGSVTLDPSAFPDQNWLNLATNTATTVPAADNRLLGRLNIISVLGDLDTDGDLDRLYSYGARSFSVWNGQTGALVYDSGNDLDDRMIFGPRAPFVNGGASVTQPFSGYDDARSDDKSVEPEAVVVGEVAGVPHVFVGLERADAVAVYNISNPAAPTFVEIISVGDAPEGLVFVPAEQSPTRRPLLIVTNEGSGAGVRVFTR